MVTTRGFLAAFSCAAILTFVGCGASDGANGADGQGGPAGGDGKDGRDGLNGKDGARGENGKDGDAVLVVTTPEPEGANCAEGGTRIDSGIDADGDGVLDAAEKRTPTFICNGAAGKDAEDGVTSLVRTGRELAGDNCAFGGVAIRVGKDVDADGQLDDVEVDAASTMYICNTAAAWPELRSLPSVSTAYSFSVAVNDVDGSARLGFMFGDAAYREELAGEGALWDGDGVYFGPNVFAVYKLQGAGAGASWRAYQGRYTPQHYRYSELSFDQGSSYYTTQYSLFGGLISVVKDGGKGTYAMTPAFSGRRAHSIAFVDHVLYALVAQSSGLTLSTFPSDGFGNLSNLWTTRATLTTPASGVSGPKLVSAGGTLVGAWIVGGRATIRASASPATVAQADDFGEIGSCADAVRVDLAWAGGELYVGCVDTAGALAVRKAALTDLAAVAWEPVTTGVAGAVSELDLSGFGTRVALAVRQGSAIRAYASLSDAAPSFDAVIPGAFDLQIAKEGLVLSTCDLEGTRRVRTFLR